jgi:hypothetical protein
LPVIAIGNWILNRFIMGLQPRHYGQDFCELETMRDAIGANVEPHGLCNLLFAGRRHGGFPARRAARGRHAGSTAPAAAADTDPVR